MRSTRGCHPLAGSPNIAVKPQVMAVALGEVGPLLTADHLIVSVAAGVPASMIEAAAPCPIRVVRAMPNTPMLLGQGAAADRADVGPSFLAKVRCIATVGGLARERMKSDAAFCAA